MRLEPETKHRYMAETALCLRNEGYAVERLENDRLVITHECGLLCTSENPGGISYRQGDMSSPEIEKSKDHAFAIVERVAEYMRNMDRAPVLKVPGVEDKYKLLAEFNGTVLAGMETKYGVNFVTWDRDFNYEGLSHGHYYANNYAGAKQDFATRSGLVSKHSIFENEQMVEIYRCCADTLNGEFELTHKQENAINDIQRQIEHAVPDVHEQIEAQNEAFGPQLNM